MRPVTRLVSLLTGITMLAYMHSVYALTAGEDGIAASGSGGSYITQMFRQRLNSRGIGSSVMKQWNGAAALGQTASVPPVYEEWLLGIEDHRIVVFDWSGGEVMTEVTPEPSATPVPDISCSVDLNTETAEASIRIMNTFNEDKHIDVYIAQYDERGALIGIKPEKIDVPAMTVIPAEYTVRADEIKENKKYIKVFVWEGMTPVRSFI